jgi:hypothetical protein
MESQSVRKPTAKNQTQRSIYVHDKDWLAARELASREGRSVSGWLVRFIQKERAKILGKGWKS